jgi:LacI family transcriptional regulator
LVRSRRNRFPDTDFYMPPEQPSPPSLAQVAALSGVSPATASRVLNPTNTHPVSEEMRARVQAAARALNYSSNALARALKIQRTNAVGLIAHDIGNPFFAEFARGASDAADEAGFLTVLCNTNHDPGTELRYLQMLHDHRVAGVLFIAGGFEQHAYRDAAREHIAAIRAYGGQAVALGPRADPLPAEVPDNRDGGRQGAEHLLALGHERIAFIAGTVGVRTASERFQGFVNALATAGVTLDEQLVVAGGFSLEGGAEAMRRLLDSGRRFTAVFASNDAMALGCLAELARRGLKAPDHVSLLGFDDIPVARWLDPALSTVAVPMQDIGAAGMRRMLSLLGERPQEAGGNEVNVHPTRLVIRASTGAPPARVAW